MKQLKENLERILKVRDADLGLFILAMHSLIERTLKEKYGIKSYDSENTFGKLIDRYTTEFYETHGTPIFPGSEKRNLPKNEWNLLQSLNKIIKNHELANDVRHQFEVKNEEDAQTTVKCFLSFAEAENWTNLDALNKLKRELDNWDSHSPYQSAELTKAIAQIKLLKSQNENLAEKVNNLEDLQNQLNLLTLQEKTLKAELALKQEQLSKKDSKVDELRKKSNEIIAKLKDYETTKEYISQLEKIAFYTKTRHDYEASVIKLTSEQSEILEQIKLNKDYLIKGAAGTGKSLVLLKTLEKAINEIKQELEFNTIKNHFKLLTYTKSLVKYNQYVTKILGTEVPPEAITTADAFLFSMLKKYFPAKQITFNFDNSFEKIFNHKKLSPEELLVEFNEFIWANNISKEEYVENVCDRIGMKNPIKKTDRALIWKSLEEAEEKLEENKTWPRNFAAKKIIEKMKLAKENGDTDFCTEYSFVDEAQDLPPVILSLIKESTNQCVFLAGDSDQSIYRKGFSWNKSGIDIRGRTKILKTNFRNTNQIHEFAESYRKNFKNMDKTTKPLAFRPGPPVELTISKNTNDLNQQLVQQVKLLLNILKYEEENICIIANQKQKLDKIKNQLESKLGVKSIQIGDNDFDFGETKGIRLCTMQNCKGLDFPVVLFIADHRIQGAEELSCFDSETYYEQQYNMVYVCLTRAMEMLHIFTVKTTEFSPFKDLTITN